MAGVSARTMDGNEEGNQKKEKLGHRRIDVQGEVSYKKVPTNALMAAIQLGIANSIGSLASTVKRDLLLQDFEVIETVNFPAAGTSTTPSHSYGDFRFRSYAPIAFRYFRDLFHIKPADFLKSISAEPLKELSNAGASGSIFYVSHDDNFIIKTVQHKEADFLQKLLPGYYMNLNQNPRTLLPKFFGLFCYQSLGKNIRLLVMNNLLPQSVEMHEKYDLKVGSTYKRLASSKEKAKTHPTLKDLDFIEFHTEGFHVDKHAYGILMETLSRDCLVLQSFKIMDYSLLVGVHNMDSGNSNGGPRFSEGDRSEDEMDNDGEPGTSRRDDGAMDEDIPGRIYARNANGDRLIIFLGIIDILQNYRLFKKLEHTWKSVLHDGDTISVHNPNFYANRFLLFMQDKLFKKVIPAPGSRTHQQGGHHKFRSLVHSYMALKTSPSRRRNRKSIGEEGEKDGGVSARDVQPIIRSTGRRSYQRADTESGVRKENKRRERLFAPSSNTEEAEELVTHL
uniref:PIPK domain-containing protein n=1 Tax=Pristionchus pacificus TaxID=54126 RepID=A0A8R1U9R3_PRIPA